MGSGGLRGSSAQEVERLSGSAYFRFEIKTESVFIQGNACVSGEQDSGAAEEAFRRALEVALREPVAHPGLTITLLDGGE